MSRSEELYQGQLLINKELREKCITLEMGLQDQIAIAALSKCFAPTEECIPWMVARAYKIADEVMKVREVKMLEVK